MVTLISLWVSCTSNTKVPSLFSKSSPSLAEPATVAYPTVALALRSPSRLTMRVASLASSAIITDLVSK